MPLASINRRKLLCTQSVPNLVMSNLCAFLFVTSCMVLCVSGQANSGGRAGTPAAAATTTINTGPSATGETESDAVNEEPDYSDADYDDKDVRFDQSPPNVLILLADPENGTTTPLANQPNTEVILDPSLKKIHLFCSAYYPIKWVYTGQGFPFLNVDNTRFTDDFYDPTTYAFSALLELEGLDESQTGNYSCQKWDDTSFVSSYYVFIPGERVLLLEKNSTVAVEPGHPVTIPCAVSNPVANVTLMKLLPPSSGLVAAEWAPVSPSTYKYHPKYGFTFLGSSNILGTYECSVPAVGSKVEVSLVVKGSSADTTGRAANKNKCCDKNFLRGLGDERTSCRGFISQSCQAPDFLDIGKSPCQDWKLTQFLKNRVEPCKDEMDPNGVNSHTGVGYFKTEDTAKPQLFMFCQADPKEYTQGFKMAVQWQNGSMLFVDDERHRIPQFSRFPAGYEVNAEITDLLNPSAPTDTLYVHCYIPLKYSFKWIKIVKEILSDELQVFASGTSGKPQEQTPPQRTRPRPVPSPTPKGPRYQHQEEDSDGHDHDHEHDHTEQEDENESSSSRAVELDNPDINTNILSERKGEVERTVEDADPTVASTSAAAFSNYRLQTSANWHVILSLGMTIAFSLVSL